MGRARQIEVIFVMSLKEICSTILGLHETIRWVVFYDKHGKVLFENKKGRVEPYLDTRAMKTFRTLWLQVILGIIDRLARYYGSAQSVHVRFSKVAVFGVPHNGGAIVAIAEPKAPLEMINDIQKILTMSRGNNLTDSASMSTEMEL